MKKLWFIFIAIFIFSFAKMIGDTVFAVGAIAFVYFALDMMLRRDTRKSVPLPIPAEV